MTNNYSVIGLVAILACVGFLPIEKVEATGSSEDQVSQFPFFDVAARKAEIASLQPDTRSIYCSIKGLWYDPFFTKEARITGGLQVQQSNVQQTGDIFYHLIESYYAGADVAERIRDALIEATRVNAFTDVKPYHPKELSKSYNGWNEPYFQLGSFLAPLAHVYLILKAEYPNDVELHSAVENWGNTLYAITLDGKNDFKPKTYGLDRRALQAAGYSHWGNATNNPEIMEMAYKYHKKAMRSMGKKGKDRVWKHWINSSKKSKKKKQRDRVYYPNMTYQAALSTAFVLYRSGYPDIYELAPKRGTIVQGMEWVWGELSENGYDLKNFRHSGTRHTAWIELLLHDFPEHPLAKEMRDWQNNRPLYGGLSGGPLTCLYRQVN